MDEKHKGGRPPLLSDEEKIALVESFYANYAQGDITIFSHKNIYQKLVRYAKSKGIAVEVYHINRSKAVKDTIHRLVTQYKSTVMGCAFVEIDINKLVSNGLSEQRRKAAIMEREVYFRELYADATRALGIFNTQVARIEKLEVQTSVLEEKIKQRDEKIEILQKQIEEETLVAVKRENAMLKRKINERAMEEISTDEPGCLDVGMYQQKNKRPGLHEVIKLFDD